MRHHTSKHHLRHARHRSRMMRGGGWRGGRFGPPHKRWGRRAMVHEFLAENPDCAEKLARFGVRKMRQMGFENDEIRDFVEHRHHDDLLSDVDIDSILEA
jgi:hypothetical protein